MNVQALQWHTALCLSEKLFFGVKHHIVCWKYRNMVNFLEHQSKYNLFREMYFRIQAKCPWLALSFQVSQQCWCVRHV